MYFNVPNFAQVVLLPLHVTPTTIVLRVSPPPYHSHHRFPETDQVQTGVIFGPGQFEQQDYVTGTFSGSGGSGGFVGAPVHPYVQQWRYV